MSRYCPEAHRAARTNPRPYPPYDAIPAAWAALPANVQTEIGQTVIEMVFGDFVGGDAYDISDQYCTREIRGDGQDRGNAALMKLHRRIMKLLPELFGSEPSPDNEDGGDPPWAWRDEAEYLKEIADREREIARLRRHVLRAVQAEARP